MDPLVGEEREALVLVRRQGAQEWVKVGRRLFDAHGLVGGGNLREEFAIGPGDEIAVEFLPAVSGRLTRSRPYEKVAGTG
jgi:hypothetical protein